MEIYAFNERAQRHAERAGWIEEGVKRKAYRSGDGWVDGVMYAILREDLEATDTPRRARASASTPASARATSRRCSSTSPTTRRWRSRACPSGRSSGADAIAQAYREQPPDDELDVLDVRADGDTLVAGYAWRREPEKRAGELRLTVEGGRITRLVVTFD